MSEQKLELMLGTANDHHLMVKIEGRTLPRQQNYIDGNWLRAKIRAKAGGFTGDVKANLRTEAFVRFRQQLSHLHAGMLAEAAFKSMENWLTITMKVDKSGQMITECSIQDPFKVEGSLTFKLPAVTLEHVPAIIQTLDTIITTFPVIDHMLSKPEPRK